MADTLNVPTCVLKVNIQCCAACPKKLKKKLPKINGVNAIDIDTKNGLVFVWGNVQPSILSQTISEKIGRKAEVVSYEKNPKIQDKMPDQDNSCSACKYDEKNQTCCFADESNDHDHAVHTEDKDPTPQGSESTLSWHGMKKKKRRFASWFGKKSAAEPRIFGNSGRKRHGYARLPPPPPPPLPPPLAPAPLLPLPLPPPPPPLPPPLYRYGQYPAVYPSSPPYRITKPPRPYPYDFYEKKGPEVGNSAFHSFRDDNVNACSIM